MNTAHPVPGHEPPDDSTLAGEYVLGVLDGGARRAFAARIDRDPALSRDVMAWAERLAPMLDAIEPVAPPLGAWRRIRDGIGLSVRSAEDVPPWWQRLGFWRGLSGAALAGSAAVLALWLAPRAPTGPTSLPHPLASTAMMARGDGSAAFLAAIDEDACTLMVMPLPGVSLQAGRVPEVWLIGPDGIPRSLGIADPARARAMIVPAALRPALLAEEVLAVSVEPAGGSPTGRPTGPVVARGDVVRL